MVCAHTHTHTHKHSYNWLPQVLANYSANCLGWQEGHLEWSGPDHFDKVFYILRKCLFYYLVISLLFRTLRSTMFMFEGLSCHCVLFVLLCLPLCLEMVLAARYICSLLCLVGLASLVRYVLLCRLFYCWLLSSTPFRGLAGSVYFYCWLLSSTPFRGLADSVMFLDCWMLSSADRGLAGDIFMETVAFWPLLIQRLSSPPGYWKHK